MLLRPGLRPGPRWELKSIFGRQARFHKANLNFESQGRGVKVMAVKARMAHQSCSLNVRPACICFCTHNFVWVSV